MAVDTANGLLVRVSDDEAWDWVQRWWNNLTEEEKIAAHEEAGAYESLSEDEREAIWNEFPESIEADGEGDEIELSTNQRLAR